MAYTTSTNVAVLLNTSFSGTSDPTESEVADIIARVEDFIEQYTGRIWSTATTTEIFDTLDDDRLALSGLSYTPSSRQTVFFLKNRPVISLDSLQENVGGLTSESWQSRATGYAGDALLYPGEGYVEFFETQPSAGLRNVKVTYTYGVSVTPNDIKYATELLTAEEVLNAQQGGQQLTSVSVGDASYQWGSIKDQQEAYHGKAMAILNARRMTTTGFAY